MVGLGGDPANHITTPAAINDDIKGSIRHGGVGWVKNHLPEEKKIRDIDEILKRVEQGDPT